MSVAMVTWVIFLSMVERSFGVTSKPTKSKEAEIGLRVVEEEEQRRLSAGSKQQLIRSACQL